MNNLKEFVKNNPGLNLSVEALEILLDEIEGADERGTDLDIEICGKFYHIMDVKWAVEQAEEQFKKEDADEGLPYDDGYKIDPCPY